MCHETYLYVYLPDMVTSRQPLGIQLKFQSIMILKCLDFGVELDDKQTDPEKRNPDQHLEDLPT